MSIGLRTQGSNPYGPLIELYADDGQRAISAMIAPQLGFNLFSFCVNGQQMLSGPLDQIKETGFYGTPILYPTPNRVRDGCFQFEGRRVCLKKGGQRRTIHGLVYDEDFAWSGQAGSDYAQAQGAIEFDAAGSLASFPFPSRLTLTYRLTQAALTLHYRVDNLSDGNLPFGFAIHPYFVAQDARIQVPARRVYESDAQRFPIRLTDVEGTGYDLRTQRRVEDLDLDDVYTDLYAPCRLRYGERGLGLSLSTSADFRHVVVYTPRGKPYFCIENQTCMTDAHNAYDRGDQDASGLIVLKPGQAHSGSIAFTPFIL